MTTKVRESNHFILVAGPPRAASTPSVLVYGAVLSTGLILLTCGGASRVYRGMNKMRWNRFSFCLRRMDSSGQ
ncbi:hypothetical protein AcV5_005655 [Taiwanofungus camphoratus]|nr:hypothetical protein AcW2_004106 [Antrodia cinnamomea]KAI0933532.1 hypothetical protein AcV5_005655 [Antrodia cinnamomea]